MASLDDLSPEPGQSRCGNSYKQEITVSGRLPNGFGAENTHVLEPVTTPPAGSWWGRSTETEAQVIAQIEEAIATVKSDLGSSSGLVPAEAAALSSLTHFAEQNLQEVGEIYGYWDGSIAGLPADAQTGQTSEWPLDASDILHNYQYACTAQNHGTWVPIREGFGEGAGDILRYYYCHPQDPVGDRRQPDRVRIFNLIREAARAVRCAEWTLWRTVLYRQSLEEFSEVDAGDFKPGSAPPPGPATPWSGPGMYKPDTIEPDWPTPTPTPIPESPADASIFEIDTDGPMGPPTPPGGPESTGGPDAPLPPHPGVDPEFGGTPSPWLARIPFIIGGVALVGYVVTRK